MIEYQLKSGWTLLAKTSQFLILEDDMGHVGVTYNNKQFGDAQVLLLKITEQGVNVKSLPHYIEEVTINFDQTITIDLAGFVENYE